MKRVVIVGGGFGGLTAAKTLLKAQREDLKVVLVDRRNHHLFQPLLYQVATAALSPADIAVAIRAELSHFPKAEVLLSEVLEVDVNQNSLKTQDGDIPFDYLILACGSSHSYFGHDEWEPFAPGLKNLEQATEIRRRILLAFELAEKTQDEKSKEAYLTFAIIGAGPTGVELAGSIAEISRVTFENDFRHIDPLKSRILLVEAGPRVLPQFSEALSEQGRQDLQTLGVEVRCQSKVTHVTADGLYLGTEFIAAKTILWAAGVAPSPLTQKIIPQTNLEWDRSGRIKVLADLSLPQHSKVFVVGDMSCVSSAEGKCLPPLAPVAIQAGQHAAQQILADLNQKKRSNFRYIDKGQMATIGRKKAVLEMGSFKMKGYFAWLAWLLVHIYYLVGFKNKFFVFVSWAWSYLTFKKGARLIVNKDWRA